MSSLGCIVSKTHFKPTGGNSYLYWRSYYHPCWKQNVPFSPYCLLKRNCTSVADYILQGQTFKTKFIEKGYNSKPIDTAFNKYLGGYQDGSSILPKSRVSSNCPSFITKINNRNKDIEQIIPDNWNMLRCDQHLATLLPEHPQIMFRRANNIRNSISPSRLHDNSVKAQGSRTFLSISWYYQCGKPWCKTCSHVRHGLHSFEGPNGSLFFYI